MTQLEMYDDQVAWKSLPVIADQKKMETLVGRELPAELFEFAPWGIRLVVVRDEPARTTQGGLYIPDQAKEWPTTGRVVSVGPGKVLDTGERSKMQVKEGDRVLFTSYAGTEVKLDVEEYLIMDESDVLAIVK